ncbi:Type-2 restriction enzyme AplI [Patescibacteria group bacterium]|nr:Type-2 restriction enzyme AplI [Patescibacteria group bacterium]
MRFLSKSKKSPEVIKIINEAIDILESVGIPMMDKTERNIERMAMAFLAVANVTKDWKQASDKQNLKTRDIINFNNNYLEENISSGSYDDIRRKDLKLLVLAGLVVNSADNMNAATNDPTRGYSLESSFMELIKHYKTQNWSNALDNYLIGKTSLKSKLARERDIEKIPVIFSTGEKFELSSGSHNILQKLIIEEFLPRYGKGSKVLYLGDTANKLLYVDEIQLKSLNFFELSHDKLPDIIAYDEKNNWLYLIEAVHSSGAINEMRLLELKSLTENCTADIIYVTAFLNRTEFKKWITEIAWETEVWIADNPDHLIHFNGDKFLGPYLSR